MAAPIKLCDTAGMDRKRWLECRKHGPAGTIPYTIGGSDVSVVFGDSPWSTPQELWRIKKGLMEPDDTANATAKEMGHIMEPVVAQCYAMKTGNNVIPDTGLYQHAGYEYALANLDYRIVENGRNGVLECKTTDWHNAESWADDHIPYHYELQVRFYLAVMDLEFADIACMWGLNPDRDMVIRRIERDLTIEAMIFEKLDEFIDSLVNDIEPTMVDVNPAVAMASLARIYAKSQVGLPTVEFGPKHEKALRRIAALQADNTALKAEIERNEGEITAHSVRIVEAMRDHETGELVTATDRLVIKYPTRTTRRTDTKRLKEDHPAIYDAILKTTTSRKLTVTIEAV